jgi:hypothetical protein
MLEAKQPQWERHETNFTTNKVFQAIQIFKVTTTSSQGSVYFFLDKTEMIL